MYQTLEVEIVGVSPLLMHNGQTADPLNRFSKMMKEINNKRPKTDADMEELARIEYVAGLYMDENGPILPARMIEAVVVAGARKAKAGRLAQAGIMVERHSPLIYDGPRTAKELYETDRFRSSVPVRVKQQRVVRTRPIFPEWGATLHVSYQADVINRRQVELAIREGGIYAGFGDWRPKHGRYALRSDLAMPQAAE